MKGIISRFIKNQKGVAMVEFAIVIVPLLFLVMGIVEFGWLFNGRISVTSAAREGARVAVVGGDFESAVIQHLAGSPVTYKSASDNFGGTGVDKWIEVTVEGQIDPLVGFFVKDSFDMTAVATMRQE